MASFQMVVGQTFDLLVEGQPEEERAFSIATDKYNNVYLISGGWHLLKVSKRNPEGVLIWEKKFT